MKEKKIKILWSLVMVMCLLLWGRGVGYAKVTGVCSNCHTMHNSQGGTSVETDGPYGSLLNSAGGCVGCHTGTNAGTGIYPFVFATDAAYGDTGTEGSSNTLAGGNFRWVEAGTNAMGHNVYGIADYEMAPPGYPGDSRGSRQGEWGTNQLTCSGTYGCHGDPASAGSAGMKGAHHGTASFGDDYRWLKGIAGLEMNTTENKWEYQATNLKHNQYKGVDRTTEVVGGIDTTTISSLCGQCHGNFHAHADISEGTWDSPWKRHPTDYDMGNVSGSEYGSYNVDGTYSVQAPVASDTVSSIVTGDVFTGTDNAIVMCLSCHRAHGTPNTDLLRWEYTMDAASGVGANTGCFICHTTKDDV